MRSNRIKLVGDTAVYHCISRIVAGEHLLDDVAKEVLRKMLWKTAEFCGVEILAYCVLSNHFHVLVRVVSPEQRRTPLDRAEILRRYRGFYGETPGAPGAPPAAVLAAKFEENGEDAERWETRLRARMDDVSEFMKTLKQRFTIWYNKNYRRFGTLWSERFKSVLVEDSAFALKTVAAYIDLNAVRAGLVNDPGDYRWCSYAEVMGGNRQLRKQYARILGSSTRRNDWRGDLEAYRIVLFGKGGAVQRMDQPAISDERAKAVLKSGGRLELSELLRARVRYFTEGAVLGSRAFVQAIFNGQRRRGAEEGGVTSAQQGQKSKMPPHFAEVPLKGSEEEKSQGALTAMRKPRSRRTVDSASSSKS